MTDRIERDLLLRKAADEVWDALTDPERLEQRLADEVTIALHPGGAARFRSGDIVREGWAEEVLPPSASDPGRLAFWWSTQDEPASRVGLTVFPHRGGGSRVRVVEHRPLDRLELIGTPLSRLGSSSYGPALVAA